MWSNGICRNVVEQDGIERAPRVAEDFVFDDCLNIERCLLGDFFCEFGNHAQLVRQQCCAAQVKPPHRDRLTLADELPLILGVGAAARHAQQPACWRS